MLNKRLINHRSRLGFSLFEIAIGLSVLSVVLSGILPFIQSSMKTGDTEITLKRMDDIEAAMVAYRLANKRVPCPASMTAALTTSAYGTEAATPGTCTGLSGDGSNAVYGGVPVKTIGLPDEWGFDAWGRRFVYHVDKRMTNTNATDTYGANDTTVGIFSVYDGASTPALRTSKAVYMLVSHGMNGHGGYMLNGTARKSASSANTHEQDNCDCNASATTGTYNLSFYQHMSTTNPSNILDIFDDIVRYRLRPGLDTLVAGGGGSAAAAAGSTGQVQFNGGANVFAADSNFFWDNTNKRLGLGNTTTPAAAIDIASNTGGTWSTSGWGRAINLPNATAIKWATNGTTRWGIGQTTGGFYFGTANSDDNSAPASYPMFISNAGYVGIGTGGTATQVLDVNGYQRVRSVNGEGGTILLDGNNGTGLYLENTNGTFRIVNSGWTAAYFHVTQTGNVGMGTGSPSTRLQMGAGGDGWAEGLTIHSTYPTIYFRDTDARSAMIHVNGGYFHVLRGCSSNDPASGNNWCSLNGYWPVRFNLEDQSSEFGGTMNVRGYSAGGTATGINAYAQGAGGTAVYGFASDTNVYGTLGYGNAHGVYGQTNNGGGYGVYGYNSAGWGVRGHSAAAGAGGVMGYNYSTSAVGYLGYSEHGVYGVAGGSGYGVYAQNNGAQWAMWASAAGGYGINSNAYYHAINGNSTGGYYGVQGHSDNAGLGGVLGYSQNWGIFGILGHANYYSLYGAGHGYISGDWYANAYYYNSDARLKENVQDISGNLDSILKLRPVTYQWKKDAAQYEGTPKTHAGLIAQEVEKVLPIVVKEHKNVGAPKTGKDMKDLPKTLNEKLGTTLMVDYNEIVPFLIGAAKDLKKLIDGLSEQVAALFESDKKQNEDIAALKAEVKALHEENAKLHEEMQQIKTLQPAATGEGKR